jgi:hypothetical protein
MALTNQKIKEIDYIGLESGILETYNALKNEKN